MMEQIGTGASEGIASMLGLPVDAMTGGLNALGLGIENPVGGSESIKGLLSPFMSDAAPETAGQRIGRRVGQDVGAGAVAGPVAGVGSLGGMALNAASGVGSGLAGGATAEVTDNPIANIAASLMGGMAPVGIGAAVSKAANTRAAVDAVPQVDDLQAQARQLYEGGRHTGMTAPGALTQGLEAKLGQIATDAGLIAPDGSLAPKYEGVRHALKMAGSYSGQDMAPEQMQQVRKALQAAAQSADPTEARVGTMMLREFDGSIRNPLVPEFAEGDKLYSRAMRGKEIDEAIKVAGTRKTNAEGALSNEFGSLARREIRGDLTYPDELVEAVERVAQGRGAQGVARELGRASPTNGIVGGGIGAGLPFLVGNAIGGPGMGAAATGAASGTGLVSRLLANHLAARNAEFAAAVARNGAPISGEVSPEIQRVIQALLATQSAQALPQ